MALVPSSDQDSDESAPIKRTENDETPDQGDGVGKMSFLDHLDELRNRLVVSISSLLVGVLICFGFIDPIFDFIMEPLTDVLPEGGTLVYTEPAEAFLLNIKMAALAGLLETSTASGLFWQGADPSPRVSVKQREDSH